MNKQSIIDEQAEIAKWLSHHGGPSIRPDWGALQPLYDRAVARGHRLVRILVTIDQPCSFELDNEPIGNDALIGFAKAALGLDLDAALLKTPAIRPKKRRIVRLQAAETSFNVSAALFQNENLNLSQTELQDAINIGKGVFERTFRSFRNEGETNAALYEDGGASAFSVRAFG